MAPLKLDFEVEFLICRKSSVYHCNHPVQIDCQDEFRIKRPKKSFKKLGQFNLEKKALLAPPHYLLSINWGKYVR